MRRHLVVMLMAGLAISPIDGRGQGRGNDRGSSSQARAALPQVLVIDQQQEQIIRDWFGNPANLNGLPPGLAQKDKLPPGLQRQLKKNGKLPPGLQRRIRPLPLTLDVRLPRMPDGKRRVFLGGNVIILDQRTSSIVDMITGIF